MAALPARSRFTVAVLRNGDRGEAVKALQTQLQVPADGDFGPATEAAVRAFQEAHGLEVDGLAGADTMAALTHGPDESAATCEPGADLPAFLVARVARVRSFRNKDIRYKLGRGGHNGKAALPGRPGDPDADDTAGADCSGSLACAFGLARGPLHEPPPAWFETSQIVRDATGLRRLVRQIEDPLPGCGVAYPDHDGDEGHCGMVTEVSPALRGVDCSSSRSKKTGQAITERGFEFFRHRGAIFFLLATDPEVSTPGNC